MSEPRTIIELRGVTFRYDGPPVLDDVNLEIKVGDFAGIVGPNGGGKTTLLKLILGLLRPQAGSVQVFGLPPGGARGLVGYVPQQTHFDREFPISVMDVVLMGRLSHSRWLGPYGRQDRLAAEKALGEVELEGLSSRRLSALSGGQRQRVLIARALASEPKLLLLDEPTASVDQRVEQDIYDLLRKLNRRVSILLVSHDLGFVSEFVNRVVCVNRKVLIHPVSEVTGEFINEVYGGHVRMIRHDHACDGQCQHD